MTRSAQDTGNRKRSLYTRCCDGIATSDELHDMYDREREISYRTFARHVDAAEVAALLGYAHGRHAEGLRLSDDRCVRFYRSTFKGEPCYYMDWSSIDHIYLFPEQVERLRSRR